MEAPVMKIGSPNTFTIEERNTFVQLLIKQGKVRNPTLEKVNRCLYLCIIIIGKEIVSIGAIKPKTNSDFDIDKADMESLRNKFDWEIGYCYTLPDHTRGGHSTAIVDELLEKTKKINLMASTELTGSSMRGIIERCRFKHVGKPFKSGIHEAILGLFIKIVDE